MYIRKWLNKKDDRSYIEADEYGIHIGSWGQEIYMDTKPYSNSERKKIIEKLDTLISTLSLIKQHVHDIEIEENSK